MRVNYYLTRAGNSGQRKEVARRKAKKLQMSPATLASIYYSSLLQEFCVGNFRTANRKIGVLLDTYCIPFVSIQNIIGQKFWERKGN